MYASELRAYALGAVVCVLLGGATGFGWHYFVDTAGATVVASAATPSARQDAPNPPSPNPPAPQAGPALSMSLSLRIYPTPDNQADTICAKCALRITHAENTRRADRRHRCANTGYGH